MDSTKTLIALMCCASATLARATDIPVTAGQSIQAAIVQSVAGDRVLVHPGTYVESIDFLGKDIQVIGIGGSAATILDGANIGVKVVTLKTGEPPTAVLSDFTVRNASTGVFVAGNAHPTLRRLIVEGHQVLGPPFSGFGIYVQSTAFPYTQIEECIVRNNWQAGIAGSYYEVVRSVISGNLNGGVLDPRSMRECLITGNVSENGGGIRISKSATIDRCVITNNTASKHGGGLYATNEFGVLIQNCEFAGNHAGQKGGGIYAWAYYEFDDAGYPTHTIENCIIHDNTAATGGGVFAYADKLWSGFPRGQITMRRSTFAGNLPNIGNFQASIATMTDCIVWNQGALTPFAVSANDCDIEFGYAGTHILNVDPLFIDATNGDYRLSAASPCIGAGSPALAKDFEGDVPSGIADIGGDEFAPHLSIPGIVSSGGPISIQVVGSPGSPVLLFASTTRTGPVATLYGNFALGFPLIPGFPIDLGQIPSNSRIAIQTTVPALVPVGTVIHMQAFVGGAGPALTLPITLLIN